MPCTEEKEADISELPYVNPIWTEHCKRVQEGLAKHLCRICKPNIEIRDTEDFLDHMSGVHESQLFFHEISRDLQEKSLKIWV